MRLVASLIVPSRWLDVLLGWGLTTVAFTAVALVVLRMADDDWARPPLPLTR